MPGKLEEELKQSRVHLGRPGEQAPKSSPKPSMAPERSEKPVPSWKRTKRDYIADIIVSDTKQPPDGYERVAEWAAGHGGGVTSEGRKTKALMYCHVRRGGEAGYADVLLYNAGTGDSPATGAPPGYRKIAHWDCAQSVDAFGKANTFNVSLCVQTAGEGKLRDLQITKSKSPERKGFKARGQFNGMTIWALHE